MKTNARQQIQEAGDRQTETLRQLEFQAVFDLSLAITRNRPEEGLARILESYLLEKLGISHFMQFNLEEGHFRNVYCHGKMVAGWKTIPVSETGKKPQLLAEFFPEFKALNPHTDWLIPFHFDGLPGGIVLCQQPKIFSGELEEEAINLLQTLFGLMMMASENQKLLTIRLHQESLKKELDIARQVQKLLFPRHLPESEHLQVYATYLPQQEVGGDYFDFIPLDNGDFAFCVADVSGKGMPAALLMSNFQACLRTLMMDFSNLAEVVSRINRLICSNSQGERFITAFIGHYRKKEQLLQYVNCGHLAPFLISPSGQAERLLKGCTILGIFENLPALEVGSKIIETHHLLAAFTDGLSEIENAAGTEFGEDSLQAYFAENRNEKMPVMHQRLLNRLDNFAGNQGFGDDITLLTLRFGY